MPNMLFSVVQAGYDGSVLKLRIPFPRQAQDRKWVPPLLILLGLLTWKIVPLFLLNGDFSDAFFIDIFCFILNII
jgi:hypothetical protein